MARWRTGSVRRWSFVDLHRQPHIDATQPTGTLNMQPSARSPFALVANAARFRLRALPALLAASALLTPHGASQAGATLYDFGAAAGDSKVAACDDCFQAQSLVGVGPGGSALSFSFFAKSYTSLFVNNNGAISMGAGVSAYTGQPMPYSSNPLIAPYWADVDTRAANSGTVWYRADQSASFLSAVSNEINHSFLGGDQGFNATFAEVVTWDHVGYYNQKADKLNTFQAVIVSDGMRTYAIFKYPEGGINWTRGDVSPANSFAQVGFDAGDGVNYYNAVGTLTAQTLQLPNLSSTVPVSRGTQVYRIDGALIQDSPTSVSPDPQQPQALRPMQDARTWAPLDKKDAAGKVVYLANGVPDTTSVWAAASGSWTQVDAQTGLPKAASWTNGHSARFAGRVDKNGALVGDVVKVSGAVAAQRVSVDVDDYSFTAVATGDSLQLSHLDLPTAQTRVSFKGGLVVLTHLDIAGQISDGAQWVQGGVLTKGQLTFTDNSVLVARGVGAIAGASLLLEKSAQVQLYTTDATTKATSVSFSTVAGGAGGTLDLRGFNTTVGMLASSGSDAGRITNSGPGASRITTDFDDVSSTFKGRILDGTGALALTKAGTGTLILSGVNTYTGATNIQGGTLSFQNNGQAVASLGTSGMDIASGATMAFKGAYSVSAPITGLGRVITSGAGTLALTGTNTYSGGTTVAGGVIAIARSANLGTGGLTLQGGTITNTGDVITTNDVILQGTGGTFNTQGGYLSFNGAVSGSGGLVKSGSRILTFNGDARYTGATAIQAGTLKFQNNGQASAHVGTASIDIASGARMLFTGSHTVSAPITGAGQLVHEFGGTTTLTGDATHTGGTSIIGGQLRVGNGGTTGSLSGTVNNNGSLAFYRSDNTAFNGSIQGTGGLIKAGAGQLALSGTHTYTGTTTVEAGELKLNGNIAGSAVTVQAGARLSGNAQVGDLTVAGDLNPGNSPGLLTAGKTTFMGGGQFVWELQDANGAAGVGYDTLSVNGTLTFGGGSTPFVVALSSLALDGSAGDVAGFNVTLDQRFTLVSTTGGILNYSPASMQLSLAGFSNDLRGGRWSIEQAGKSLDLVYTAAVTAVPEPEGLALALGGVLVVLCAAWCERRSV
jgi:autotransporter-associated beta strand protein